MSISYDVGYHPKRMIKILYRSGKNENDGFLSTNWISRKAVSLQ